MSAIGLFDSFKSSLVSEAALLQRIDCFYFSSVVGRVCRDYEYCAEGECIDESVVFSSQLYELVVKDVSERGGVVFTGGELYCPVSTSALVVRNGVLYLLKNPALLKDGRSWLRAMTAESLCFEAVERPIEYWQAVVEPVVAVELDYA